MPSAWQGNVWNPIAMPARNKQTDEAQVIPSRSTEKDEEYLVVLTIESLGQAFSQLSDDSFVSRMIGHNPGAELIEIAWTFHNKGQSGVFLPLDGHLSMVGTLALGTNDITGVADLSMSGDISGVTDISASGDISADGDVTAGDQFLAAAGDATTPGYAFTDEPDTGMFSAGTGILALTNDGTEVVRWDSSDNQAGFGTTNPEHGFHFVTTDTSAFYVSKSDAGACAFKLNASNGDARVAFARADTIKSTIGNDGSENDSWQVVAGQALGTNVCICVDTSSLDTAIGDETTPDAQLHVVQVSTSGAQPVVELEQNDVDQPFIEFDGTESANATDSLSSYTTGNSIQGFIQVTINGTKRWIPHYDDPTS